VLEEGRFLGRELWFVALILRMLGADDGARERCGGAST
jgi:hypothetical protein